MRAVRDSDVAAESIGIDPLRVRVVAFAVSASFAGLAGALTAPLAGFVTPSSFHFGQSILFVLVVMLGGSGRTLGPLLGALIVVLLPEMLSGLAEYRLLVFGALLLLVLWIAPEGVAGLLHRAKAGTAANSEAPSEAAFAARPRRALEARGFSIAFGGVRALDDFDFAAYPGRIHALIGPNGAGKTTALNLLTGYYLPDRGHMRLGDTPLPAGSGWRIARAGIARTYQTTRLFGSLSVEANVALALLRGRLGAPLAAGAMQTSIVKDRVRALLDLVGYTQNAEVAAHELSLVDQRLVEIARALAIDPDAVFLDEPAAGLSREDKARLAQLLRDVAAAGIAVVLVEHDMALVMECADEITVLESGVRIAHGTPAEVRADARVRRSYLGESAGHAPRVSARMEGAVLLETLALEAGYGGHPVLRGIDVRVREKEAIALLGANGAGKSTLMRAIAGLHRPVRGQVVLDGESLERFAAHRVVQRGVVLVPEGRQVFPDLTVLDNLRLGAYHLSHDAADMAADIDGVLMRFPKLRDRLRQRAGSLSGGEQQMLAVARGLMAAPRVLLLDEPSLGLAPMIAAELFESLEALRRGGLTLVVVDQMAPMALALCDRVYVLEGGGVGFTGSAGEVAGNPALERAYLGVTAS
jgi:ABC-type branched-subunit amino acid transport system ATPase component